MNRNLFVVRAHCHLKYPVNYEQFTEPRVFPLGMTFAQVEALLLAELRETYDPGPYDPSYGGWYPPPECKVSFTARPNDDPAKVYGKERPLFYSTWDPTDHQVPYWMDTP